MPFTESELAAKHANMTVPETWKWHAKVYAHRRVVLGIPPDVRTSPTDENGVWFHEGMVEEAERELRERLIHEPRRKIVAEKRAKDKNFMTYSEMAAAGRRVSNQWAQKHGHADFRAYVESRGLDFSDDYDYATACAEVAESIIAAGAEANAAKFKERRAKYRSRQEAAAALRENGVTARETPREYDPEALRAGRIGLGLEPAQEAAE